MEPANLFAACRANARVVVKRIRLDRHVQEAIQQVFADQERSFRRNVTEEVEFDGGWKAEPNEILTLKIPDDARVFLEAAEQNPTSIPTLDTKNFASEGIRALFTTTRNTANNGRPIVLIQLFRATQLLSTKWLLILRGDVFTRMEKAAFTVGQKLECIIEDERVKFKSFHNVRQIIGSMGKEFRAATEQEMHAFAAHASIVVDDVEGFVSRADETVRKMVRTIAVAGLLEEFAPNRIIEAGKHVGFNLDESSGRIVLPNNVKELKRVLHFLNDGLYRAPLTKRRYITNSKRPVR